MIVVDGSQGEGGGQIVRMAMALSALRGVPVTVTNIRAGRPTPGLAAQHVTAIQAVAALCRANVDGLEAGSREIVIQPGSLRGGRYSLDVGTAGSITLVLQACLPVAFAAREPVKLRLSGGTDVRWSPPLDYFGRVFLPMLRRLGCHADIELIRRGYYPRGGGVAEVTVDPAPRWSPLEVSEPGALRSIHGIAHVSNLPSDIPKRMRHAAMRRLHGYPDVKIEERVYGRDEAVGQGGALVLWAETDDAVLGATSLAERGKSSEKVGEEAATGLRAEIESGAAVDVHAADQLLVYLAHADGPSTFTVRDISDHLHTMVSLLRQFVPRGVAIAPQGTKYEVSVVGGA